jgi:hypothetical protein
MSQKGKITTQTTNQLTTESARWAINNGYKKPVIYELNQFRLIIDIETGLFGVSAIDDTIKAKITVPLNLAQQIADLPSETLNALAYTDDLKEEFNLHRNSNIMLGRCFVFAILKVEGDPLEPEKITGDVNQWTEEILITTAYRYRALLDLINVSFKAIKKNFPDMSFNKPEQLFFEIIRDEQDSYFERIATTDFMQILTDALSDIWQGILAAEPWEELEKRSLAKGLGTIHKGIWLHRCLEAMEKEAKQNQKIRGRLKTYYTECENLIDAIVSACIARSSGGKIKKSIQWRLGVAHLFDKCNHPTIPLRIYKT